jgi:serine O-acetyltransferase
MLPESFITNILEKHMHTRAFPATSEIKKLFTKIVLTLFPEQSKIHFKTKAELKAVFESLETGLESILQALDIMLNLEGRRTPKDWRGKTPR